MISRKFIFVFANMFGCMQAKAKVLDLFLGKILHIRFHLFPTAIVQTNIQQMNRKKQEINVHNIIKH